VYRNGSLWTTHHVAGAGGKLEVAWYQINPATASVVQQGRISDMNRWYYYPSIAVNQNGDVAVGFSGSDNTEFASGWYTARNSADANGTMQTPSLLKAGLASYFKSFQGSGNRWGDYSATVVDPADNVTFWTLQEYAATPVGGISKWGTWWGKFQPPATMPPALDCSFTGLGNPTSGDVIPPDTMGAVGPNHLVSILNSNFGIFDKPSGAILSSVTLQNFWASLGAGQGQPAQNPFDPKVLYDTSSGRFVAATLGGVVNVPSWLMVTMSATSDPTGIWYKVAIRADQDADNVIRFNGADYTCLGVDADHIYVSANMFDNAVNPNFKYSKVWVISKSEPLLNGGTTPLTWAEFRNPPGSGDSMQPAHTFETAPAEYFIYEGGSGLLHVASITFPVSPPPPPPPPSSGGGGGGCAVAGKGQADPVSSGAVLLLLFLPACVLAARRRIIRMRPHAASRVPPPRRPAGL